jgi:hypothetical protein
MGARVSVIFTKNSKTFHHLDQIRASYIPGTLAKGLASTHFGEKDQIALKNKAVA